MSPSEFSTSAAVHGGVVTKISSLSLYLVSPPPDYSFSPLFLRVSGCGSVVVGEIASGETTAICGVSPPLAAAAAARRHHHRLLSADLHKRERRHEHGCDLGIS
ncbi:hypothetical protein HanIR_Chr16g0819871 [Helianthus annuus]|nr:hypothetical protein HanIR_Chr16g0819871 [Helianthus annuus]